MVTKAWRDMTPEERGRASSDQKRRKFLRDSGRPSLVPAGPARRKVRALVEVYAMSTHDIAVGAGVSQSTVSDLLRGHRGPSKGGAEIVKIPRTRTHDKIMAFEPDPSFYNPNARVPATGSRRRLQALALRGFSLLQMSQAMGHDTCNQVWRVARGVREGKADYVYASTREGVAAIYTKLLDVDPLDIGGDAMSVSRAQSAARRHGYAPAECWDDDTIDDPSAFPEYTGACGTAEGYGIHVRETLAGNPLPPCQACRAVVEVVTPGRTGAAGEASFRFRHERFDELLTERGTNPRRLAVSMGRDPKEADRFYRWRTGDRNPQNRAEVHALANALDVHHSELMVDVEPDADGTTPAVIGSGAFNPYMFKAVIEAAGLSHSAAGRACGVSHSAVDKWVRAEYSPGNPEVLDGLAAQLGVDRKVFYS